MPLSLCRNGGCGGGGTSDGAAAAHAAAAAAADFEDELTTSGVAGDATLTSSEETNSGRVRFATARSGRSNVDPSEQARLLRHHRLADTASPSDDTRSIAATTANAAASSTAAGGSETRKRDSAGTLQGHHSLADVISATSSTITRHASSSHGESQRRRKLSAESCKFVHDTNSSTCWVAGVNSLGERLNYDNASTKANAGSQYHFDSKVQSCNCQLWDYSLISECAYRVLKCRSRQLL